MPEHRRALVMCAHDDDEVIGLGGTIRKLANAGVHVTTVIFAEGDEGYTRIEDRDKIVDQRRVERGQAQQVLGTAECVAHGFHDFDHLGSNEVYREIIRAVRLARPHVVFTHLPTDYQAHRTLAQVAPEAVWQAGWKCSAELGEPWQVKALYRFSVLELIAKPSHIVDITDTLEAKLKAMQAYRSQRQVVQGILEQIQSKARAYGSLVGVEYGEAFVRSQAIPIVVPDPQALMDNAAWRAGDAQ